MSMFISYNFETGHATALAVAKELARHNMDAWWFPDPLPLDQLDSVVERGLANCQRCILIWSRSDPSPWQFAEITALRSRLARRSPIDDPTDFILVLRNLDIPGTGPASLLPLLQYAEYVDYRSSENRIPDLGHLSGYVPGMMPLTFSRGRRPRFRPPIGFRPQAGRHFFSGDFHGEEGASSKPEKLCWVLLEDVHGQLYVQQPRPTFSHRNRWTVNSVLIGTGIRAVVLAATGPLSHRMMVDKVLRGDFGAIPSGTVPSDFEEIDRIAFVPT